MAVFGSETRRIKEKGVTILEGLVATAIVGIGFVAIFQMVTYSVQSIDVSSCLLYTSPSPRDNKASRMPSSA